MSIKINSNIASLRTQRALAENGNGLGSAYEKLSSGQRITKASDDSASRAIAESLNVKTRVYAQGIRNFNDGISLLNVADSALSALTEIVVRLKELGNQSANGVYSDVQRQAIDKESQALSDEYTRIAEATSFNGQKLLDGSLNSLRLQGGFGVDGSIVVPTAAFAGTAGSASVTLGSGTGSFLAATTTLAGTLPYSVVAGDLNGDQILDIISANLSSNTVNVLIANGNGTFGNTTVTTGNTPYDAVLGDLNGDTFLDIISADYNTHTVSVLLGNGNGTFAARTPFAAGTNPISVTVGYIDNDNILDIVSADYTSNTISVFIGNGNGTFDARVSYAAGNSAYSVAVADVDDDGFLDIFSVDRADARVKVFINQGNGTFSAATSFVVGAVPYSATAADVNGDDILDLLSVDRSDDTVSILLGNGNGTFAARTTVLVGDNPRDVSATDLNGDGFVDIVSADFNDNTVSVLFGNGNGTFGSRTSFAVGTNPRAVTTADLDGDGSVDILAAVSGTSSIGILLGISDGSSSGGGTTSAVTLLDEFTHSTRSGALASLSIFDTKLEELSSQRGMLGASLARIGSAISVLQGTTENFSAAESRIRDVDVAEVSAELSRRTVLQQAATAVLAQANQQPSLVLSLLE